jgi:hypothetical protein
MDKALLLASALADVKKQVAELQSKADEIQKLEGPSGPKGDKGDQGPKGEQGDRGFDGKDGKDGRDGVDGKDGDTGKQGVGVVDAFIDFDQSLVLKLSDGNEINAGSVEFNAQKAKLYSVSTQAFSLDNLKVAATNPKPTEVVVKQNGEWVRATWSQFTAWIGSVGVINKLLTEGGDFLVAEDGSYLIEE